MHWVLGMCCLHTSAAGIREFTEAEVERATNGYRELIGTGGFGSVYKGKLQYADVAVKVLSYTCCRGKKEAMTKRECHFGCTVQNRLYSQPVERGGQCDICELILTEVSSATISTLDDPLSLPGCIK